jgi:hypothetical protein
MGNEMAEIARAVRWYLPGLVGDEARDFDCQLAALLAAAELGADVDDQLNEVFLRSARLHEWAALSLGDPGLTPPPLQSRTDRSYAALPGSGQPVAMEQYRCPSNDFVWYRVYVEDGPPRCPTHGQVLVLKR